jgi:hypothetical protein
MANVMTATSVPAWTCPVHTTPLTNQGDRLICPEQHEYKVAGSIFRFVGSYSYSGAFGIQWNRHRKTQLDSYTSLPISEIPLRRCLGLELSDLNDQIRYTWSRLDTPNLYLTGWYKHSRTPHANPFAFRATRCCGYRMLDGRKRCGSPG